MTDNVTRLAIIITLWWGIVGCQPSATPAPPRPSLGERLEQVDPLLADRRYSEAVTLLEEAARHYPDAPQPLIAIGQIYLKQQRLLLAEDAFNRALVRRADDPRALAGLAETLFDQRRLPEALSHWQRLAAIYPDFPGVFTGLGRTRLWRLDFEAAIASFTAQQTHQFDPEAAWYLAALSAPLNLEAARVHLNQIPGDVSPNLSAQQAYLRETLAPFSAGSARAEIAKTVGLAMAQAAQWPLAVNALTTARDLSPQPDAQTLAFLAYALAQLGQPALDLFDQAVQGEPDSPWPHYFRGLYLRQQGALRAAETAFREAIRLDPLNPAVYVEFAKLKEEQGDLYTAEEAYLAAVEVAPDKTPFQLLLVGFYADHAYRLAEAGLPAAQALLKTWPDNAEVYNRLGWIEFLVGDVSAGEESLRQALALDPELTPARYHLARLLEAVGQPAAARSEYQRVADWDTGGLYRDKAIKDLLRLAE